MTLKTLAAAACISLASATTAISAPITLDFEFDGVTGTFFGLDDAGSTSTATSLNVSFGSNTWTGLSLGSASSNEFEILLGDVVDVSFGLGPSLSIADTGLFNFLIALNINDFSGDAVFEDFSTRNTVYPSGRVTYKINPVSAVPLPAGGLLLLSAFGGVAALKRRKKRAA